MEFGLHLPLMEFGDEGISRQRLTSAVSAARDAGFTTVAANDHFLFSTPWLDGPTALASAIADSGDMKLMTSIALAVLRGPMPLAKTLAAIDLLSGGRLIAGVGPGSSRADYEALGVPFEERWQRLDEAIAALRSLLGGERPQSEGFFPVPASAPEPLPAQQGGVPIWVGSWGSRAGLRRVARLGDGWLASAYNTTPDRFADCIGLLGEELEAAGSAGVRLPNGLATMWTWVTDDDAEAERILNELLAPMLGRDAKELGEQLCIGPPARVAEILSRYQEAGCERVLLWLLGSERRQIELIAETVMPRLR
jgi:alkanesulfonate monooxygenase SsuD/methylene tetrahydromethanopterin reductase-like flavin-dependent oxidoreductase (luciferase family)